MAVREEQRKKERKYSLAYEACMEELSNEVRRAMCACGASSAGKRPKVRVCKSEIRRLTEIGRRNNPSFNL